jgi:hypothetical protein
MDGHTGQPNKQTPILLPSQRINKELEALEAFKPSISVENTDDAACNIPRKFVQAQCSAHKQMENSPSLYRGTNWIIQRSGNGCLDEPWPAIDND